MGKGPGFKSVPASGVLSVCSLYVLPCHPGFLNGCSSFQVWRIGEGALYTSREVLVGLSKSVLNPEVGFWGTVYNNLCKTMNATYYVETTKTQRHTVEFMERYQKGRRRLCAPTWSGAIWNRYKVKISLFQAYRPCLYVCKAGLATFRPNFARHTKPTWNTSQISMYHTPANQASWLVDPTPARQAQDREGKKLQVKRVCPSIKEICFHKEM